MPRLFFAVPLAADLQRKLFASFHQKPFHGIRFTPQENLHLTVHFLGSTEEGKLEEIIRQTEIIAESFSSFEMKFAFFKIVFHEKKPVMIWAAFEENAAFEKLCLRLRKSFPTEEKRKPDPHITMARIKQLKTLPFAIPFIGPFSFMADHLELWESKLHSEGSIYRMIQSRKLK